MGQTACPQEQLVRQLGGRHACRLFSWPSTCLASWSPVLLEGGPGSRGGWAGPCLEALSAGEPGMSLRDCGRPGTELSLLCGPDPEPCASSALPFPPTILPAPTSHCPGAPAAQRHERLLALPPFRGDSLRSQLGGRLGPSRWHRAHAWSLGRACGGGQSTGC